MARDHRKLDVFTMADQLAVLMYQSTIDFPASERFGLRHQLRRAAVSIPTNIVEGCARDSGKDFARFLDIAFGSTREVIYLTGLARRLTLMEPGAAEKIEKIGGRTAAALAALKKAIPH